MGLITNAGAEHLEGFGSLEGVARAEGEMVAGLDAGATAVINADDAFADLWRGMTRARIATFGIANAADYSAQRHPHHHRCRRLRHALRLVAPQGSIPIELHLAGQHNVLNALCAAAAAAAAGASLDDVRAGLATMRPVPGRLQFKTAPSGAWIVDDSYNANPSSMKAGIEVLVERGCAALAGHGRHGRARRLRR